MPDKNIIERIFIKNRRISFGKLIGRYHFLMYFFIFASEREKYKKKKNAQNKYSYA